MMEQRKELAITGIGLNLESEGNLLYSFDHRSIGFERPSVICCGMSHFLLSLRTGTTPATLLHKPPVPIFLAQQLKMVADKEIRSQEWKFSWINDPAFYFSEDNSKKYPAPISKHPQGNLNLSTSVRNLGFGFPPFPACLTSPTPHYLLLGPVSI